LPLAYLGLGTNVGDRRANLAGAIAALMRLGSVEAVSRVYETEPVGKLDQPDFWNMVLRLRTVLAPADLLRETQAAERRLGRTPTVPQGPRVIDIDLLLYDDLVLRDRDLEIPHPRMMQRAFVLRPLLEIDPDLRHAATAESLAGRLHSGAFERVRPLFDGGSLLPDAATSG
jgi:2-amino-4-hydroxy-6-hydroxymethyldihydropteridine diphosphokinase